MSAIKSPRSKPKPGVSRPNPCSPATMRALGEAAECLRALAHPVRLRMIQRLLAGKYTVGELAEDCGVPENVASENLRFMQRCGFLASERDGRRVFYRVAEPHLKNIVACVEARFPNSKG
jgi:ArsR family transcriptional regulator, zinc-responsive transcriptional repressor